MNTDKEFGISDLKSVFICAPSVAKILLLVLALSTCSCTSVHAQPSVAVAPAEPQAPQPPPAPREFRGIWVASVNNGNWPSKPGLPVEQQKKEMIDILDHCVALNANAVVFQVRPCADALYQSSLEPWSEYLTGTQGQPPSPLYDPLQLWIEEAHRRGLELHAWFNPYRVKSDQSRGPVAANSIAKTHPEVVKQYGGYLWMDPGEPLAAQHTLSVILDIVRRYDIDAVHTDDYYYPYKVKDRATNKIVDFPDEPSFNRYKQGGGKLARDDWRRDNINQLVSRIYTETKKIKPWVKVGYAPFGIWKPQNPPGIKGLNQYEELYADAKLWLNKGWLDYMSPQLFWKIGGDQDFAALLKWWLAENTQRRYIWPGMSVGRHSVQEVINQIELTRQNPQSSGQVLWSVNSVLRRAELYTALQRGPYAQRALVPPMTWLDSHPPPPPVASVSRGENGSAVVSLRPGQGEATWLYAVYARYGEDWQFTTVPGGSPSLTLNPSATGVPPGAIVVSAVDRCGNESQRVTLPSK